MSLSKLISEAAATAFITKNETTLRGLGQIGKYFRTLAESLLNGSEFKVNPNTIEIYQNSLMNDKPEMRQIYFDALQMVSNECDYKAMKRACFVLGFPLDEENISIMNKLKEVFPNATYLDYTNQVLSPLPQITITLV